MVATILNIPEPSRLIPPTERERDPMPTTKALLRLATGVAGAGAALLVATVGLPMAASAATLPDSYECEVYTADWLVIYHENFQGCVDVMAQHPEARMQNLDLQAAANQVFDQSPDNLLSDVTELRVDRDASGKSIHEVYGRHGVSQAALRVAGLL
jgi:hypothetical protein